LGEINRLEMRGITKRFGGVKALDNVDLFVRPGEVHALMGENGAGKSTLMKVLSGVQSADSGEIYVDGQKVLMKNPCESSKRGISVIYQEHALATDLSAAENIYLENITVGRKFINWKHLNQKAHELLDSLNFGNIDEKAIVSDLSVAYQQIIEICKAISKDLSILVLDEPTALLSNKETERLFELISSLRSKGISIIYISHRLEEIFWIADRITVLKDGENVGTVSRVDVNKDDLVNMMVGRSLTDYFPKRNAHIGDIILEVCGIYSGKEVQDVSFSVRQGEVLGLAGLIGSGRTETAHTVYGLRPMEGGYIHLQGREIKIQNPRQALRSGIAYLSEDRKDTGVLLNLSVQYNVTISVIDRFLGLFSHIKNNVEVKYVNTMVDSLNIKVGSVGDEVFNLSGGNQQKVSIGKVLSTEARVLIFDEPTRGVDVGSKREIYKIINSLAESGAAVIMISSEMEEIIGMCDRVVVMREGRVMGELEKDAITEQNMIHLAMVV
jgi:ribose transport system ATP-binding protein